MYTSSAYIATYSQAVWHRHLNLVSHGLRAGHATADEIDILVQGLTAECVDLLHKLLDVDPDTRITVPQILQHPWFLKALPAKLAELNTQMMRLPLSLLSENCQQTEEEIAQLAAQASKVHK